MKKLVPSVSIVIPAYNEERYLKSCLQAIAEQTTPPEEVIVVDNNSSDSTALLAKQFPFITVISESQQGSAFAQYAGFRASKSDVMGRIDADTVLARDWVEQVKKYFTEHPEAAAITGYCEFYDFPARRLTAATFTLIYYRFQKLLTGSEIPWGANMAIRRSAWLAIESDCHPGQGVDEDIDLGLCLQKRGMKVGRSKQFAARVSLRRGAITPLDIMKYLRSWPKDYWINRFYIRAAIVAGLCLVLTLTGTLLYPFAALAKKRY